MSWLYRQYPSSIARELQIPSRRSNDVGYLLEQVRNELDRMEFGRDDSEATEARYNALCKLEGQMLRARSKSSQI